MRMSWKVPLAGLVLLAGGAAWAGASGAGWRNERWVPEDFTGVVGGGPPIGPAAEAGGGVAVLCGDQAGNLYLLAGNSVLIVTPGGVKRRLAGTGVPGHRDGPAYLAQFNQGGGYNVARSIQCDGRGNIFLADNGNKCVRRIFKKNGKWWVDTWAGGGKRNLKPGESCAPREANLIANIAVAAAPDGALTIAGAWFGFGRVTADGKKLTRLGPWPTTAAWKGSGATLMGGDCDRLGNAYFVSREGGNHSTSAVVRVSKAGKIEHIGGLSIEAKSKEKHKPHRIGDGPPRKAYFDTPDNGNAVSPDGSCVYVCGGDEYDIRRVPTDGKTTTATLVRNGRWYVMPVHPNRNRPRRPCTFDPKLQGKSQAEGGPLGNLENCHVCGRDYQGNLYGFLYSWCGQTLRIAGKGFLHTRVYRLRLRKDRP